MTIDDQITLFFKKIRESQGNSRLTADEALDYLNDSRRSVALVSKFYDVRDTITAAGGETYWTLRDDLLGLIDARDCVTRNGYPVTIKAKADWETQTQGATLNALCANESWGMLQGNTFYIYPPAKSGDIMVWQGYGEPPQLTTTTGGDAYLNNTQAETTVLDAAVNALEDLGGLPGPILMARLQRLTKEISKRAKPRGPRLENAPDNYAH